MAIALLTGALGGCGEDGDRPPSGSSSSTSSASSSGGGSGTSSSSGTSGSAAPTCATPATLTPPEPKSSRFIVSLREGTNDVNARITALESKYGFTATHRFERFNQFAASLTNEQVAGLRCEPDVAVIQEDQPGSPGG